MGLMLQSLNHYSLWSYYSLLRSTPLCPPLSTIVNYRPFLSLHEWNIILLSIPFAIFLGVWYALFWTISSPIAQITSLSCASMFSSLCDTFDQQIPSSLLTIKSPNTLRLFTHQNYLYVSTRTISFKVLYVARLWLKN